MKEVFLCVRVWVPIDWSESDAVESMQGALDSIVENFGMKDAEVYLDENMGDIDES